MFQFKTFTKITEEIEPRIWRNLNKTNILEQTNNFLCYSKREINEFSTVETKKYLELQHFCRKKQSKIKMKKVILFFNFLCLALASRESISTVSSSRDRVTVSLAASNSLKQRLVCPDQERSPVIEKAWFGLEKVSKIVDCK